MAKKKDEPEILKIPSALMGIKYKKVQDNWEVTFEVDKSNLNYLKPLMAHMQEYFMLVLIKADKEEIAKMNNKGIGDIEI